MQKITPYLWFETEAEEAVALYTSLFTDAQVEEVTRYGPGQHQAEGSVMTVAFRLHGQQMVALNGGPAKNFTEAVSLQVACESQEEVDHFWDGLTADGGEPGRCGWLKDRFGLSWQVVPTELPSLLGDPDPDRAARAVQAMLQMTKLDIAEMRRAADQG